MKESDKSTSANRIRELDKEYSTLERQMKKLREDELADGQRRKELDNEKKNEMSDKSKNLELNNTYRKEKDRLLKTLKKLAKDIADLEDQNLQKETEDGTTTKMLDEKEAELRKKQEISVELDDEIKIFKAKTTNKEKSIEKLRDKLTQHEKEQTQFESELVSYKQQENIAQDNIKKLAIMKEKMARTASQANQQARERKEELKILRLTILDLSKKHQETKFRLDSFVSMYENVKSERNKYVTMIQNCSQALAESKEKDKILQNEIEILRNELLEKEQKLRDTEHKKKRELFEYDRQAKEISALRDQLHEKKEQTTQQAKEIANLNLIVSGINRDIKRLISKYEDSCESRNYMGIQLIDRNDELCILYEKSNIQESILKRGENEIKGREEEIRMLSIELADKDRELSLIQKKAPEVPVFAEKVVSLKAELEQERAKVKELSEKVEDPEKNPGRIREVGSDVPEQEFLEAKVHVLEERLNLKKEALLEKELVLEEITNLSEKLRKQALEGRKGTLELAEKINEFRAKTTELSRKMLATVAEVSMFQATAMKLEQEKQAKEKILEESKERLGRGEPPTPDAEAEWQRMERQSAIAAETKVVRCLHLPVGSAG